MAQQDRDEFLDRHLRVPNGPRPGGGRERESARCADPRQSAQQQGRGRISEVRSGAGYGFEYGRPNYTDDDTDDDSDSPGVERQDEQWDPLGNFFHYVFAGGKQCCAMRDHFEGPTEPMHSPEAQRRRNGHFAEAAPRGFDRSEGRAHAKRSEAFGRGGRDQDSPSPRASYSEGSRGGYRRTAAAPVKPLPGGVAKRQFPHRDLDFKDSTDSGYDSSRSSDRGRVARASLRPPPVVAAKKALAPPAAAALGPGRSSEGGGSPPRLLGRNSGPEDRKGRLSELPQPKKEGPHPRFSIGSNSGSDGKGRVSELPQPKKEGPDARKLDWRWPSWCLTFHEKTIEVYVVDEETGEEGWVDGEPQTRVVDKEGRDAYLCVEYDWHGECYVQDFEPQHVRRIGTKQTVLELVTKDAEDRRTGRPHGILRR